MITVLGQLNHSPQKSDFASIIVTENYCPYNLHCPANNPHILKTKNNVYPSPTHRPTVLFIP